MTRPRSAGDPAWCVKTDHDDSEIGLHKSQALRAGAPGRFNGRGEVTVWLEQGGTGPTWLAVNVAHMASATGEITIGQAVERNALDVLIELAQSGDTG